MVSSPAQPRPRLASVTPTCVTLSSRPGFASRPSAARADALPSLGQLRAGATGAPIPTRPPRRRRIRSARRWRPEESAGATLRVYVTMRAVFPSSPPHSSHPLLRAINLSIAVLLIALLGAAYWFAWRPLAQTSGQITAPVSAKATIVARRAGSAAHPGRVLGGRDLPARLRHRAGSHVADGRDAQAGGG